MFRRVKVPPVLKMRSAVSKGGSNASLAGEGKGMEKPKRARKRKPETAKVDLKPFPARLRRTGCPP